MLDYKNSGLTINTLVAVHSEYAVPDVLRAYAAFKTNDLGEVLRRHLLDSDVVIRGRPQTCWANLRLTKPTRVRSSPRYRSRSRTRS